MPSRAVVRRRELLLLAASGVGNLWLPRSAWSQPRLRNDPFALGVASGSPGPDSVVLWTRLVSPDLALEAATAPITVLWQVADDDGFRRIVRSGQVQARSQLAHSVHAEVAGLAPDRWYYYRFMLGQAISPLGRTRTLPAADAPVARLRIGFASCQKWEDGYFSAWRHMRDENLDAVLFLGDYIYEYPGNSSRVRRTGTGWVISLADYRQRHALYKSDPDLQACHAAYPWLTTWDDHEVQNDYAGLQPGNSGPMDPSLPANFAARRQAAYQAYYEHMPLRASVLGRALAGLDAAGAMRIYSRLQFGRLLSLLLLDGRQYRDPMVCTRDGRSGSSPVNPAQCPQWADAGRTLLGWEQERWMEQTLALPETGASSWTVIGQQSLFGQRDFRPGPGQSFSNDGWDGYPAARSRLTRALRQHHAPNPVLLGGDVHANWVGHVKADYADATSDTLGVEFCGTSISSRGGDNERTAERMAENPHFVFSDAQQHGYGVADFTPARLTTTLRVVDDVTRRDARLQTLARFAVQAGRPRIERA